MASIHTVVIDKFEYATDEAAAAAWTSSFDSYTKLLLHMEGVDATFVDSALGKTITASGTATQSATQKKFGSKSAYFNASDGSLSVAASSDFKVGSENFTIDFWFYPTTESRYALLAFSSDFYLGMDFNYNGTRNVNIWASSNATSWDLIHADSGGSGIGSTSLSLDSFHHIAFVRNGNNWMTFIDGTKDIDITVSGSVADTSSKNLRIGTWGNGLYDLVGYIDEFRFSKGIARWTSNFTPPTAPYDKTTVTSDSAISEGSYSLKVTIPENSTGSTITHSTSLNLSGLDEVKFYAKASETGSNLKLGLHNSTGTTTEANLDIATAENTEEIIIDISSVSDSDKNDIDSVIVTVTGTSSNVLNLDDMEVYYSRGVGELPRLLMDSSSVIGKVITSSLCLPLQTISGSFHTSRTMSGSIGIPMQQIDGSVLNNAHASLDMTLPALTAVFRGAKDLTIYINRSLPAVEFTLFGGAELVADLPMPTLTMTGGVAGLLYLDRELPVLEASFHGFVEEIGKLVADIPLFRFSMSATLENSMLLESDLPPLSASFNVLVGEIGQLNIALPAVDFLSSAHWTDTNQLIANLPSIRFSAHIVGADYKTLVLNVKNFALTEYDNSFNYNSIAFFNGKLIMAKSNGIYEQTGTLDVDSRIDWSFKTGKLDQNRDILTKIRHAWITYRPQGDLILTVDDGDSEYEYPVTEYSLVDNAVRVKLGKGFRNRYLQFKINNNNDAKVFFNSIKLFSERFVNSKR